MEINQSVTSVRIGGLSESSKEVIKVQADSNIGLNIVNTYNVKSNTQDDENSNINEKTIIDAIEKANKKLVNTDTNLEFAIHEKTKQIMVKVINKETEEVVKEIPSEKILDMVASMCEAAGLMVDEKV